MCVYGYLWELSCSIHSETIRQICVIMRNMKAEQTEQTKSWKHPRVLLSLQTQPAVCKASLILCEVRLWQCVWVCLWSCPPTMHFLEGRQWPDGFHKTWNKISLFFKCWRLSLSPSPPSLLHLHNNAPGQRTNHRWETRKRINFHYYPHRKKDISEIWRGCGG